MFFVSLTNSEKLWALIPTQVEIDLSEQVNVFSLDKTARLLYHNALNIIAWLSSNKADSYCLTKLVTSQLILAIVASYNDQKPPFKNPGSATEYCIFLLIYPKHMMYYRIYLV